MNLEKACVLSGFSLLVLGVVVAFAHASASLFYSQRVPETPTDLYRVFPLDIASSAAIARCARAGGIAGWLQAIDANGDYTGTATISCAVPYRGRVNAR